MRSGPPRFAADASKTARVGMRPCDCRKVSALPSEAERAVQQASRLIDRPEWPQDHTQPAGGNDSVIEDEPRGKMVIPLVVTGREGLFKVRPRAGVIALEPASYAKDVRSGRVRGGAQGGHRHLAHRREVGTNKAYHPHAIIS